MKVISDTSPLSYFVLIRAVDILPELFGSVTISEAVQSELSHGRAPDPVRVWINEPPTWIKVAEATVQVEKDLLSLHPGERETILLAEEMKADLVLLDDHLARVAAEKRGLRITGTIGVIHAAGELGLVDIPTLVDQLKRTNFRAAPSLYQWLLRHHPKEETLYFQKK